MGKLFETATKQRSLKEAWLRIRRNGSASLSAETRSQITRFEQHSDRNIYRIQRRLHRDEFEFEPQKGVLKEKSGSNSKRGIVMASVHNRIVERALLDCMQAKCEYVRKVIRQPTSVGGVPHRSVPHGLAEIRKAFQNKKVWFARSDISGFFDNVPRTDVIRKLADHIDDQSFISLLERATKVILGNEAALGDDRSCFPTDETGVAQGSPLSPLFGNVLLFDFDQEFNERGIVCIRFIDDFVLLGETEAKVQKAFDSARKRLQSLGLSCHDPYRSNANKLKSECGHITDGFDFLGYRIEPGLVQPSEKARKALLKTVDDHFRIGRRAIYDCIRENSSLANRQRYAQTHDVIDRVLKGWGNAFAYSESYSTQDDLDRQIDKKLDDFRAWFARTTRNLDANQKRRAGGVCLLTDIDRKSLDELPFEISGDRKRFRQSSKTITISTDGSALTSGKRRGRDKGPGGWAYVVHETEETASGACANVTNNHMELLAVVKAIEALPTDKSVIIRTDSQYVAQSFNNEDTVKSNLDLWRQLKEISAKRPIKIVWIKGHAGDKENELADKLANAAAKRLESELRNQTAFAA